MLKAVVGYLKISLLKNSYCFNLFFCVDSLSFISLKGGHLGSYRATTSALILLALKKSESEIKD